MSLLSPVSQRPVPLPHPAPCPVGFGWRTPCGLSWLWKGGYPLALTPILQVRDLKKSYRRNLGLFCRREAVRFPAVDGVSFDLLEHRTLGILGESGCGKTTLSRCILGVLHPDSGQIFYRGTPVDLTDHWQLRQWRRRIQLVYQDSLSAFDPKHTMGFSLREALAMTSVPSRTAREDRVRWALDAVSLAEDVLDRFPTELSGGQCQRLNIARALLLEPEILILDEPVSAMDATVQLQILHLLLRLQRERALTYLFISHDLPVVNYVSDQVLVMFRGQVVEQGPAEELFHHPAHPYTQSLVRSASPDTSLSSGIRIRVEKGAAYTAGCPYASLCSMAQGRCRIERPAFFEVKPGHICSCFAL